MQCAPRDCNQFSLRHPGPGFPLGVVVRHLDFGNDEQLPPHDVQPLKPYYTSFPVQGIPCRVDNLSVSLPNGVGERLLIEGWFPVVIFRLTVDDVVVLVLVFVVVLVVASMYMIYTESLDANNYLPHAFISLCHSLPAILTSHTYSGGKLKSF